MFFLFNAFYAFPNQALALEQLRNVADDAAILAVFDYTDPAGQFERANQVWHGLNTGIH